MAFVLVPAPADVSSNTFCFALHTDTALQGENNTRLALVAGNDVILPIAALDHKHLSLWRSWTSDKACFVI